MRTKKEIMDANKFKNELQKIIKSVEKMKEIRDYQEWVLTTNSKIAEINRIIRSTNTPKN